MSLLFEESSGPLEVFMFTLKINEGRGNVLDGYLIKFINIFFGYVIVSSPQVI